MTRTPQQIFDHHLTALKDGDLDELVADYADDAVLITAAGVARGRDGIRAAFGQLSSAVSITALQTKTQIYDGDVLLLEWVLDTDAARVDGVDTFVFDSTTGLIRVQTISQSVHPKG
ncbi:nuclear transport factor 2 family protein [Mycobacterium sp. M1]|uniref:Nuclear transport factor 2 family protein n=1 Tax=Mycolicibacter acidiphilus TaxID=2835306 RepID=A0ABS5RNA5_9MYCO|nr:nuclear transport factor 2 family protein [Mycolicibacter acidiphilus]MBS9535775.1 nuclear transport factor 2 family protein [Mycolicibacter acidiphilus]